MSVRYFGSNNPRLRWFYVWLVLAFLVLLGGLVWRQLIMRQVYQAQEDRQNLRRIVQPAPRGRILDIHGNVLVGNRPRFSAVVYLDELRQEFNRAEVRLSQEYWAAKRAGLEPEGNLTNRARLEVLQTHLDQIAEILGAQKPITLQDVRNHFNQRLLMPFPLVQDLAEPEYARLIEQLPLGSKVAILTETTRHYPYGETAAHTLGYVVSQPFPADEDLPDDDLKTFAFLGSAGKNGLEATFNETLKGEPGIEVCIVDRNQVRYRRIDELSHPPERGEDLQITLSLPVQQAAEAALGDRVGAAVALNVRTGEVRALASSPAYDLNAFSPRLSYAVSQEIESQGAWLHRAVQGLYPPGSTFKVVTASAALRSGVVGPREQLYCGPFFEIADRRFPEHSRAAFGWVDIPKMLQKSSNVFCYQVGQDIGIDRLSLEARRFGLDEPTGIEQPHETGRMRVPDRDWFREYYGFPWRPGDTANVSIGQGDLRVTPLQMASLAASVARGETRTDVTLLPRQRFPVDHGAGPLNLPVGGIDAILDGMAAAAAPGGTASAVALPGMNVAAKTGTAQVQLADETLTLAWLIGFAPAKAPEVAVAVVVEGQQATDHFAGGRTAAPIAREILQTYFDTFEAPIRAVQVQRER